MSIDFVFAAPSRSVSHDGALPSGAPQDPCAARGPAGVRVGDVVVPGKVWVAPMTGVSDLPFRRLAARLGAAYVATEMVACREFAGGRPDVVRRAAVGDGLPLTVIQLLGAEPDMVAGGAAMAEAAGADIVDLNFGCPAKEVTGAACGAALMRDPDLAARIVEAAVRATRRAVTVKMRLGWDDRSRTAARLARLAEAAGAAAVTVHGRTRTQFYGGRADWAAIREIKAALCIPVVVNGDIVDAPTARHALDASGADAVMLGRGVYGRPWLAAAVDRALAGHTIEAEPGRAERLAIALDHLDANLAFYGDDLGLRVWRKHLGWYVEAAPWPADALARREAKAKLCRIGDARVLAAALAELWLEGA